MSWDLSSETWFYAGLVGMFLASAVLVLIGIRIGIKGRHEEEHGIEFAAGMPEEKRHDAGLD